MEGLNFLQAVEDIIIAMEPTRGAPPPRYRILEERRRRFRQAIQGIADLIRQSGGNPDPKLLEEIQKAFDREDLDRVAEHLYKFVHEERQQLAIHIQTAIQPGVQKLLEFLAGFPNKGINRDIL